MRVGVGFTDDEWDGLAVVSRAIHRENGLRVKIGQFRAGVQGDDSAGGDVPEADVPGKGRVIGAQGDVGQMQGGRA